MAGHVVMGYIVLPIGDRLGGCLWGELAKSRGKGQVIWGQARCKAWGLGHLGS